MLDKFLKFFSPQKNLLRFTLIWLVLGGALFYFLPSIWWFQYIYAFAIGAGCFLVGQFALDSDL